ncbi:hypothetical protein [Bacillus sp. AFS041924]|uniref:hypothetical protein n=1 Tax=Bacillus sp. AFS041924 TaxID=2033503 RepID=UPI000BFD91D1|nr:hypothetical protein [Bacillus sp. AFS041924]PGS56795.1 hypothetical protein COC46_00085 [Bacillus sp. AFS041924]
MKKYEKMLIGINDEELNCFTSKGDWLYISNKKDTKKGLFTLPSGFHYFVSINEKRMPSEIGVVKKIPNAITARELAELEYTSRKKDKSLINDDELKEYEWFLEKINAQPEHTPMGTTWFERIFPKKEKELRVHKKFFSGLSKEEKKELFVD